MSRKTPRFDWTRFDNLQTDLVRLCTRAITDDPDRRRGPIKTEVPPLKASSIKRNGSIVGWRAS